jgi:hypothetical protein
MSPLANLVEAHNKEALGRQWDIDTDIGDQIRLFVARPFTFDYYNKDGRTPKNVCDKFKTAETNLAVMNLHKKMLFGTDRKTPTSPLFRTPPDAMRRMGQNTDLKIHELKHMQYAIFVHLWLHYSRDPELWSPMKQYDTTLIDEEERAKVASNTVLSVKIKSCFSNIANGYTTEYFPIWLGLYNGFKYTRLGDFEPKAFDGTEVSRLDERSVFQSTMTMFREIGREADNHPDSMMLNDRVKQSEVNELHNCFYSVAPENDENAKEFRRTVTNKSQPHADRTRILYGSDLLVNTHRNEYHEDLVNVDPEHLAGQSAQTVFDVHDVGKVKSIGSDGKEEENFKINNEHIIPQKRLTYPRRQLPKGFDPPHKFDPPFNASNPNILMIANTKTNEQRGLMGFLFEVKHTDSIVGSTSNLDVGLQSLPNLIIQPDGETENYFFTNNRTDRASAARKWLYYFAQNVAINDHLDRDQFKPTQEKRFDATVKLICETPAPTSERVIDYLVACKYHGWHNPLINCNISQLLRKSTTTTDIRSNSMFGETIQNLYGSDNDYRLDSSEQLTKTTENMTRLLRALCFGGSNNRERKAPIFSAQKDIIDLWNVLCTKRQDQLTRWPPDK